jgi:hypothetical protein
MATRKAAPPPNDNGERAPRHQERKRRKVENINAASLAI